MIATVPPPTTEARDRAREEAAKAMANDPRLRNVHTRDAAAPTLYARGPASSGPKKTREGGAKEDMLMAELERQLERVKIGDRLFCKHRTLQWDSPDVVTVCVTPWYAVVLNQPEGHLEVRWWEREDEAGGGGLEHHRTSVLENSHGYLLDRLPHFSYAPGVLGVCDALGRVELWDPATGGSVRSFVCTTNPSDADSVCVSHPSAFAVSSEFVVLATSDTPTTSSFYVRRWAPNEKILEYGKVDKIWDKFKCALSVPRFMRVGADQPYE